MNFSDLPGSIGLIFGFVFTILVFSYLIGDNPFFRFTSHLFIGVAAALVSVAVIYNILLGQIVFPILQDPSMALMLVVPAFFGLWLLVTKLSPRLQNLGNPVMGYLVGVAAATAITGVLFGTLFPQVGAVTDLFNLDAVPPESSLVEFLFTGIIVLFGTIATFLFFHFDARQTAQHLPTRLSWIEIFGRIGQYFISITFGALFAGVYIAAVSALVERLRFLVEFLVPFFSI